MCLNEKKKLVKPQPITEEQFEMSLWVIAYGEALGNKCGNGCGLNW